MIRIFEAARRSIIAECFPEREHFRFLPFPSPFSVLAFRHFVFKVQRSKFDVQSPVVRPPTLAFSLPPFTSIFATMADSKKQVYDESKIKTLSSIEHIRLRTGMYIGRIGDGSHYDDGCYILLKEVIDNAIDEYIMGYGKEVQINIQDKSVSVGDFGRGIPLGK